MPLRTFCSVLGCYPQDVPALLARAGGDVVFRCDLGIGLTLRGLLASRRESEYAVVMTWIRNVRRLRKLDPARRSWKVRALGVDHALVDARRAVLVAVRWGELQAGAFSVPSAQEFAMPDWALELSKRNLTPDDLIANTTFPHQFGLGLTCPEIARQLERALRRPLPPRRQLTWIAHELERLIRTNRHAKSEVAALRRAVFAWCWEPFSAVDFDAAACERLIAVLGSPDFGIQKTPTATNALEEDVLLARGAGLDDFEIRVGATTLFVFDRRRGVQLSRDFVGAGFQGRGGRPSALWELLLDLAAGDGVVEPSTFRRRGLDAAAVRARVKRLNKALACLLGNIGARAECSGGSVRANFEIALASEPIPIPGVECWKDVVMGREREGESVRVASNDASDTAAEQVWTFEQLGVLAPNGTGGPVASAFEELLANRGQLQAAWDDPTASELVRKLTDRFDLVGAPMVFDGNSQWHATFTVAM